MLDTFLFFKVLFEYKLSKSRQLVGKMVGSIVKNYSKTVFTDISSILKWYLLSNVNQMVHIQFTRGSTLKDLECLVQKKKKSAFMLESGVAGD